MKTQKLAEALDHVGDRHIERAARSSKKKRNGKRIWLSALAAGLVIALVVHISALPGRIQAHAVAQASGSRQLERPRRDDYDSYEEFAPDFEAWQAQNQQLTDQAKGTLEQMLPFLQSGGQVFLEDDQNNAIWSPVNAYIGLAMVAELAEGDSRQEILDLLGASDQQTLRQNVTALWETIYEKDGKEISVLANSLWLDQDLTYDQEIMDTLARDHYASVYQGDLHSEKTAKDMATWISNATGGFLESGREEALSPETVLALLSTLYFRSKWSEEFSSQNNTQATFHSPGGDLICTFMNAKERQMTYHWGASYGAVELSLKNGSSMWLILPDADKSPGQVLTEGEYLTLFTGTGEENSKYLKVNLSLPQFDIQSQQDLKEGLERLGLEAIFAPGSDFSASVQTELPVAVQSIRQACRVAIDEEGVTAGAYLEIPMAGAAAPLEEVIDFVLDRPFLFAITSQEGVPLFCGVVQQP